MKLTDVDKNFAAPIANENGIVYFDPNLPPFDFSGLPNKEKNGNYRRLPTALQDDPNLFWGVKNMQICSTGGMIRFKTDSDTLAVKSTLSGIYPYPHFSMIGLAGMDVYIGKGKNKRFAGNVIPSENEKENVVTLNLKPGLKEITINLPTYAEVLSISVGVKEGSKLLPPTPFKNEKPICFYGSSITQGGCCSHPGTAYPTIVCRELDAPMINLGFSGSCQGEIIMADYINTLDLTAYVYDYDHNCPTIDFLRDTHLACYERVREKNPDLPIVILSKPDYRGDDSDDFERRNIIMETYRIAKERGDRVAFVDGKHVFDGRFKDGCTTDGCHPNDLGFSRMAIKVLKALNELGVK